VREECLDKLLIVDRAHLQRVTRETVESFTTACAHWLFLKMREHDTTTAR
jgi:hypothetical protein